MKKKIILHSSFAIGFLSVILLFSGIFSFPNKSFSQTSPSLSAHSEVSSSDGTSETITGTISNKGTATSVRIAYASWNQTASLNSSGNFSFNLTGLLPGTTYSSFNLYISSSPVHIAVISFTTNGVAPTLSSHTEVTDSTGTVETISGKISNRGPLASVQVDSVHPLSTPFSGVATIDASGNFSITFSGFTPGVTYDYNVSTPDGSVFFATNLHFTTSSSTTGGGTTPGVSIINPVAGSGGTTESFTGTISNPGTITSISVRCRTLSTLTPCVNSGAGPLSPGGNFSVNITGLTPSTVYEYSVWKLVPGVPSVISGADWNTSATFRTSASTTGIGGRPDTITSLIASSTSVTSEDISGTITDIASSTSFLITAQDMTGHLATTTISVGGHTTPPVHFVGSLVRLASSTSYTCTITSLPDHTVIADSSVCPNFITGAYGIGGFSATVSTSTGLTVSGNGGGVAKPGTDITIRVGTSSTAIGDITSSTTVNPDGTFIFIIGSLLDPGRTYYYSISDSPTDPAFSGSTVTGATGSFTMSGIIPGTVSISPSAFLPKSNISGTSINFTAVAVGSSAPFVFSFLCSTSISMTHPVTQTYNVVTGLPDIHGLVDVTSNPVTSVLPYYCEIVDSSSHLLTAPKIVTLAGGQIGVPFVADVTASSVTIGLNFASSTILIPPPHIDIYYGLTSGGSAPYPMYALPGHAYNFAGTITGLASSTSYVYSVLNDGFSAVGGTNPGSPFGSLNQPFRTLAPPPTVPTIPGEYPTVDNSQYLGQGIVRCLGGVDSSGKQVCGFPELMAMIQLVIGYLLFIVAPAIVAVYLGYAGVLYLTSGGSTENLGKAKKMMTSVIVGWVLALCAWIIVKFIMTNLGYDSSIFPTFY